MHARIPTPGPGRRTGEHGIGLVEVIVVLLIIAILIGIMATGRQSSQRAGAISAARAAGASYHDAVQQFMRDHGGRTPVWGSDWPNAARGPINAASRNRPYLDQAPEAVNSGRVLVTSGTGGGAATGDVRSRVAYVRVGARGYRLLVQRVSGAGWTTACEYGTEGGSQC